MLRSRPFHRLWTPFLLAAFAGPLAAQKAEEFAGEWMSNFGPMKLEAKGKGFEGTSGWGEETKLQGRLDEGALDLEWSSSSGNGSVRFELWEGGAFLGGTYRSSSGSEGKWNAYRRQPSAPEPSPGEVTLGQTTAGLRVHLRVPRDWKKQPARSAILILHGSNMTARAYVDTIAAAFPALAEDFVVVGLDGENLSSGARPDALAFNYSYVNFGGPGVGPLSAQRQSPALVAESIQELGKQLGIERWIVGGHSQGGFLTYAVAMFYPSLVAGVFPMSCNLLVQCEPDGFTDEKLRKAQRALPFAIVHGRNDPVVEFSGAEACRRAFEDAGFPAIGFFDPPDAAHMFARLPVEEAVRWIDAQSSQDPVVLAELATQQLEKGHERRASAAALAALERKARGAAKTRAEKVLKTLDKSIAKQAGALRKLLQANADGSWVDEFWEFRSRYGLLDGAQEVLAEYAKLRKAHGPRADELFWKARGEQDPEARKRMYREMVERWYASRWTPMVQGWLRD